LGIFINEDLISKDQAKLRKEVQKVKEAMKEGKWAIIRNRKLLLGIETIRIIIGIWDTPDPYSKKSWLSIAQRSYDKLDLD
jgi:hypothetical protein